MMSKRISELAKEWAVSPKDLLAAAERISIRNKRSTSAVTDEEAERIKEAMGLIPKPAVTLGAQRVVGERMVTEREAGAQLVTAREQTTETRLKANVIRRRTAREVVKREELPGPVPGDLDALPPSLDFDYENSSIPPPLGDVDVPPPASFEAPPPVEAAPATPPSPAEAEAPAPAEPVAPVEAKAATPEPEEPTVAAPSPAQTPPVERRPVARQAPPPPPPLRTTPRPPPPPSPALAAMARPAPQAMEEQRGPKVLGKIDLRRATAPPVASGWRPAEQPAAPAPLGFGDPNRKKKGRKVIEKDGFAAQPGDGRNSKRPQKRRAMPGKELRKTEITVPSARKRIVRISEVITVADLAKAMGVKASEILKKLLDMGSLATINQALDYDSAALVAGEFDYQVENVAFDVEQELGETEEGTTAEEQRVPRAPVVTIMGHVDHGKTSLLDAIRQTEVAAGEAGGITQHIGAYSVDVGGRSVTFLDTPGHEAFTQMRSRGAKVTDLVVLVVAADDGIMPQTIEAINHARAAEVPIVVAVNKIDKPDANPDRVKQELGNFGLAPEDWGGDTVVVPVSAKSKEGIPQLLEMLLLQADILELRANPTRLAKGTIVEARLDRGRGPVATVLVQEGTLKVGDPVVVGTQYGRIRAMVDDKGKRLEQAGPATPVEIQGLSGVPDSGDGLVALSDEQKARQIAEHRRDKQRDVEMSKTSKVSLDELYEQIKSGAVRELKVVLKADVHGSVEAVSEALGRLSTGEVRLTVVHGAVGGITESDVLLASASNAVVIGFNVRPEPKAAALAEREGVDIRPYTIIYEAVNDVRDALEGLLEPEFREKTLGRAEVRQTFNISGVGTICGSFITDGKMLRGAKARVLRDNIVVHDGTIGGLKRFKEDVREVAGGYECGISLENYQDVKVGDVIESYEMEQITRRLHPVGRPATPAAERTA